jgi:hypothetical protein
MVSKCEVCGDIEEMPVLKGTELEWILDLYKVVCKSCAFDMAHEAWVDNRIYQESRADHEDGVWDGEHFYPSAG